MWHQLEDDSWDTGLDIPAVILQLVSHDPAENSGTFSPLFDSVCRMFCQKIYVFSLTETALARTTPVPLSSQKNAKFSWSSYNKDKSISFTDKYTMFSDTERSLTCVVTRKRPIIWNDLDADELVGVSFRVRVGRHGENDGTHGFVLPYLDGIGEVVWEVRLIYICYHEGKILGIRGSAIIQLNGNRVQICGLIVESDAVF